MFVITLKSAYYKSVMLLEYLCPLTFRFFFTNGNLLNLISWILMKLVIFFVMSSEHAYLKIVTLLVYFICGASSILLWSYGIFRWANYCIIDMMYILCYIRKTQFKTERNNKSFIDVFIWFQRRKGVEGKTSQTVIRIKKRYTKW